MRARVGARARGVDRLGRVGVGRPIGWLDVFPLVRLNIERSASFILV